jgi:hypothetical protein
VPSIRFDSRDGPAERFATLKETGLLGQIGALLTDAGLTLAPINEVEKFRRQRKSQSEAGKKRATLHLKRDADIVRVAKDMIEEGNTDQLLESLAKRFSTDLYPIGVERVRQILRNAGIKGRSKKT